MLTSIRFALPCLRRRLALDILPRLFFAGSVLIAIVSLPQWADEQRSAIADETDDATAMLQRAESSKVALEAVDLPLGDLLTSLREQSKLEIRVHRPSFAQQGVDENSPCSLRVRDLPLAAARPNRGSTANRLDGPGLGDRTRLLRTQHLDRLQPFLGCRESPRAGRRRIAKSRCATRHPPRHPPRRRRRSGAERAAVEGDSASHNAGRVVERRWRAGIREPRPEWSVDSHRHHPHPRADRQAARVAPRSRSATGRQHGASAEQSIGHPARRQSEHPARRVLSPSQR